MILTEKYKVILLEVNHTPSFRMDSKLDEKIKSSLIHDTLQLLNVDVKIRQNSIKRSVAVSQIRLYGSMFGENEGGSRGLPRVSISLLYCCGVVVMIFFVGVVVVLFAYIFFY